MRRLSAIVVPCAVFCSVLASVIAFVTATSSIPSRAADLPRRLVAPQPQPVAPSRPARDTSVTVLSDRCVTGRDLEIFVAPEGPSDGVLPAGMVVRIVDFPYARFSDLWVRIEPPREAQYYGWVRTADLACL